MRLPFVERVFVPQSERTSENILLNVCGRVLLIQRENSAAEAGGGGGEWPAYAAPTVLASSVEILWVPHPGSACAQKPHLTQALWLCCGAHGMRVWLPLYPRDPDKGHHFMSKVRFFFGGAGFFFFSLLFLYQFAYSTTFVD